MWFCCTQVRAFSPFPLRTCAALLGLVLGTRGPNGDIREGAEPNCGGGWARLSVAASGEAKDQHTCSLFPIYQPTKLLSTPLVFPPPGPDRGGPFALREGGDMCAHAPFPLPSCRPAVLPLFFVTPYPPPSLCSPSRARFSRLFFLSSQTYLCPLFSFHYFLFETNRTVERLFLLDETTALVSPLCLQKPGCRFDEPGGREGGGKGKEGL